MCTTTVSTLNRIAASATSNAIRVAASSESAADTHALSTDRRREPTIASRTDEF